MRYTVHLEALAKNTIAMAFEELRDFDADYAVRWYDTVHTALQSLEHFPRRFPVVRTAIPLEIELRQIIVGAGRNLYTAFYYIERDDVWVLYLRHASQRDLQGSMDDSPTDTAPPGDS